MVYVLVVSKEAPASIGFGVLVVGLDLSPWIRHECKQARTRVLFTDTTSENHHSGDVR